MRHPLPFGNSLPPPPPLRDVDRPSLFLDLDGTIASLEPSPSDVGVNGARDALLAMLTKQFDGRLAIVSGRTIADLDRILSQGVRAVAGVHGLQRRSSAGHRVDFPPHSGMAAARAALEAVSRRDDCIVLEDKGCSLALHYRCDPAAEMKIRAIALDLAQRIGLILQRGSKVVELRTPGPNKADAINSFMEESPFTGTTPVFIGDDLTDECGFELVKKLNGFGVIVGGDRLTKAGYRLENVDAVYNWLGGETDSVG